MRFLLGLLGQLGMVVVIMFCATAGTVGLMALIRRFTPWGWLPQITLRDPRDQQPEQRKEERP